MDFQLLQTANVTFVNYEKDERALLELRLDLETFCQVRRLYSKLCVYARLVKKIYKKLWKANEIMATSNLPFPVPVIPRWKCIKKELQHYITPKNKNLILLSQINMSIKKFDVYLWSILVKVNVLKDGLLLCISMFIQGLYNITLLDGIMQMFKFNSVKKENYIYNHIIKCNKELFTCVDKKNPKTLNINILLKKLKTSNALKQHVYFNLTHKYECCTKLTSKTIKNVCIKHDCNGNSACKAPNNTFYKMYSLILFNK
jgi:hypothetical protein